MMLADDAELHDAQLIDMPQPTRPSTMAQSTRGTWETCATMREMRILIGDSLQSRSSRQSEVVTAVVAALQCQMSDAVENE